VGRNEQIDRITAKTSDWRGTAVANLRRIIHAADPSMAEAVKWKRPGNPLGAQVFEHDGVVCICVMLKERVRLKFVAGASLPDPKRLFNAELEGKSRAIDFYDGDKVNEAAVKALVRAGVKRNVDKAKRAKPRTR
jgi:hypothetical protein